MACILKPECNILHRYFRCLLPIETVDVEVKIKTMRGIHTFRRDCTTKVISCNPWIPRLCPHPSLIRKMKTYLELEGKLGKPTTTAHQHLSPWQKLFAAKDPSTQESWEEEKSKSTHKKEVQGDIDWAAFAHKPNLACYSYTNSAYHYGTINPDISSKANSHFC